MLNLESITLRNVVHFGNAHIPLSECPGLTCITGWNRDSLIAEDQNNAAGKSVLLASMANALYDAAPLSRSKSARKELISEKGSSVELLFVDNDNQRVNLIQTPSKYSIELIDEKGNAEDQRVRTKPAQMERIREHWPISSAEFYSYIYLQGQKELEFQRSTPVQRLTFLTDVFRLDHFDKLRRHFAKKLDKLKVVSGQHDNMTNKLLVIDTRLAEIAFGKRDTKARACAQEGLDDNIKALEEYGTRSRDAKKSLSVMSEYIQLKSIIDLEPSRPKAYAESKRTKWLDRDFLKAQEIAARTWSDWEQQLETYTENSRSLKKKLDELTSILPEKKLKKKIKELDSQVMKLTQAHQKLVIENEMVIDNTRIMEDVTCELKDLGFKKIKHVDQGMDIEQEMGMAKATLHLRDLLDKATDATCPTCTQDVDITSIKKTVKRAEKQVEELKLLKRARKQVTIYLDAAQIIEGKTLDKDAAKALKNEITDLEQRSEDYEQELRKASKAADLQEAMSALVKPKEPNMDVPKLSQKEIDRARKYIQTQKEAKRSLDALLQAYTDLDGKDDNGDLIASLELRVKSCKKKYKKAAKGVAAAQDILSSTNAREIEHNLLTKQREEYATEIEGMQGLLQDRNKYADLVDVYGKKGLKLIALTDIMNQLEDNLNRFASRIFFEPITFSIDVQDNGIHVKASSKTRKSHDVRMFSGSETDCFRLLFMLCMTIMAPSRLRTNFIVLDEPDAHMDPAARDRFIHEFLPELGMIVPSVILITPNPAIWYPADRHWVVVKENGQSELQRGKE